MGIICDAIRTRSLLAFEYGGLPRVVAPYCHGSSPHGEVVRAVQLRGGSRSGGLGFGKLWRVDRLVGLRMLDEHFAPDDPDYNPGDRGMRAIHCCV